MESPARYADYAEFCTMLNENYHREMMDYIRGLGCRIPIAPDDIEIFLPYGCTFDQWETVVDAVQIEYMDMIQIWLDCSERVQILRL